MKDQYVGDINDYVKYSLLRAVQGARHGRLLVCWMRTTDDGRGDGQLTAYLSQAERYRSVDPPLFDGLAQLMSANMRRLTAVEAADFLPRTSYFSTLLEDGRGSRQQFMADLRSVASEHELIFFDPDNGLGVESVPVGRAGSSRYLYGYELPSLVGGRSAIIYQHFPREDRPTHVARRLSELSLALPTHDLFAAYSSRVAYLFAAAPGAGQELRHGVAAAVCNWSGALRLVDG